MKCDIETVEADLLTLVQAELPGKIAEITAEKADSITLDVPLASQYFNTTDDAVNNYKLSVLYGLVDGDPFSISSSTAEVNRYMFLIYLDEMNESSGIVRKKLYRYIRALKEIFEENFFNFPQLSNMTLQSIAPTTAGWDENEISPRYKVGGVYIETSIAS